MVNLNLLLLGEPHIYLDGQAVVNFHTRKDRALLIYLAVTKSAHSREHLAGLLWSELPEAKARRNLRNALSSLQKIIGAPWLTTERVVALDPEQAWAADVQQFQAVIDQLLQSPRGDYPNTAQAIAALNHALNLYRGEFLQNFTVQQAIQFAEWVGTKREEYRRLLVQGLELVAQHYLRRKEHQLGLASTRRLLQVAPYSEQAHHLQMHLLAQSGQRAAALAQYESYRQWLATHLSIEPGPETNALYQQIRSGKYGGFTVPAHRAESSPTEQPPRATTSNAAPQLTRFVGRQAELTFSRQRLQAADCRLLTVVGPGGMGKSTFARHLQQQLLTTQPQAFPEGIIFVPLADISTGGHAQAGPEGQADSAIGEAILRAITTQLNQQWATTITSTSQLQAYLRSRRSLLILDNFEHLLGGTQAILTLLTQAPQLKMVITSRARLNVRGETLIALHKLSLPSVTAREENPTAPAHHSVGQDNPPWQASEAVTMFVQRAQQFDPAFALNEQTIKPIVQICNLVDGLPLGLELAASMLPLVSCDQLATELAENLTFLMADTPDLPPDQRTLEAVFERSWRLLAPEGQQLLARLAIFPGSFHLDAAKAIAGATIPLLKRLLDQSLVTRIGEERYLLHRTVQAFAHHKLQQQAGENARLERQYAQFYLRFLGRQEQDFFGPACGEIIKQLQGELDNIKQAWRRAVTHQLHAELGQGLNALLWLYENLGFYWDVAELGTYTVQFLVPLYEARQKQAGTTVSLLLGRLYTYCGYWSMRLGQMPRAQTYYADSWAILQKEDDPSALAYCLGFWGAALRWINPQRAIALLEEAVRLAQTQKVVWGQVIIYQLASEANVLFGNYAEAAIPMATAERLLKSLHWPRALTVNDKIMGRLHLAAGRYAQAESALREGVAVARHHQINLLCFESILMLGEALRLQGRFAEAQACLAESKKLAEVLGVDRLTAVIQWEEGCLAERMGDYATAKAYFTASIAIGLPYWWGHILPTLGWVLIELAEWKTAQEYFQQVLTSAATQLRLPASLDAQVGLAYLAKHEHNTGQLRQPEEAGSESFAEVLQRVYAQEATMQETRHRIMQLAARTRIPLPERHYSSITT
ncbi:MAG: tetratricopeptide repeat protein [Caldilineaceae bacterium]|nr:tetratricopeptide repeat protein [Caldilineaceae bacterium]